MEKTIREINSERLASVSVVFTIFNGIDPTKEFIDILSLTVAVEIKTWYDEQGRDFDFDTELVDEEAVKYAFGRIQALTNAAKAQVALETLR